MTLNRSTLSFIVAGLLFTAAIVATVTVWHCNATQERQPDSPVREEIQKWDWGSYGIVCPPVQAKAELMTPAQRADFDATIEWVNTATKRQLFTHTPQPNKPIVTAYGAWPKHIPDDGLCNELSAHPGQVYRQPTWINPITNFDIRICFNIIEQAKRFSIVADPSYESIKNTARLGNVGHIAHELLHAYIGDRVGHSHPRHGHGLMRAKPKSMALGPVVMGILKRVEKHCKR